MRACVFCSCTGEQAHGHGGVRWAERGETCLWDCDALLLCQAPKRRHIAQFALISRHAQRGITLQMLNRAIALSPRQIDIGQRHIILEIDEAFLGVRCWGNSENRLGIGRAAHCCDVLARCRGDEGLRCLIPVQRTASLHVEVNDRREPARDGEQIRVPAFGLAIHQCANAFEAMARASCGKGNRVVVDGKSAVRSRRCWPRI